MQYINRTKKHIGYALTTVCFALSIALFVPFAADEYLKLFLKGFGVIFFAVGLLCSYKFLLTSYTYRLEVEDGRRDVTVTERRYKKDVVVLRTDAATVIEIKEYKRAKRTGKRYTYASPFSGAKKYILTIDDGELVEVVIAADENFINSLKKYCNI